MQRTRPKRSGLLLIPLLVLSAFAFLASSIPPVFALVGMPQRFECIVNGGGATTCVGTAPSPTIAGNLLVVSFCTYTQTATIADTQSNSWTNDITGVGQTWHCYFWHATAKGAADTITVTCNASCSGAGEFYEVSGLGTPDVSTGSSNGASGSSTATGSTTFSGTAFLASFAILTSSGAPWTAGTGFKIATPANTFVGGEWSCDTVSAPCQLAAGVSSPTTFPISWTGSKAFNYVAAVYSQSSSATVIAACTFFQLQCWWYPLLFMVGYSGFVLLVASMLRVSPKGKMHLFLSALTFGSLIAVILGIMNIVFPLLMLVINTIIALRMKG